MNFLTRLFKSNLKFNVSLFKKICFLYCFITSVFNPLCAQDITMEQTLEFINQKFGGNYNVEVNYGSMVAIYQEGGQKYREDQVLIKDLDPAKVTYNSKTKMLLVNCKSATSKCVTREFLDKRLYYNRVSFVINAGEKTANGLIKAFQHLIKLVNERGYKSSEPFE